MRTSSEDVDLGEKGPIEDLAMHNINSIAAKYSLAELRLIESSDSNLKSWIDSAFTDQIPYQTHHPLE